MKLVSIPSVAEQGYVNGKYMETDSSPEVTEFLNIHSEFLESVSTSFVASIFSYLVSHFFLFCNFN